MSKETPWSLIRNAVLRIHDSQSKMNDALIQDLESLRNRVYDLEAYVQLVEARRQAELDGKDNAEV